MTSHDYRSLREREEAHREENENTRRRIEQAEEFIEYYRSRMSSMQEDFSEVAAREGVADDPRFRWVLERISDEVDENVHAAVAVVDDLEEEAQQARRRQATELETIEDELRRNAWRD
jgi:Na+/phosphate symporter